MLKEFIGQWAPRVEKRIKEFIEEKEKKAAGYGEINHRSLLYAKGMILSGGKRIRPVLFIAGYLSAQKEVPPGILDVAAAVELFHNFLLIHDDVIDRDELRRGQPTVWKRFEEDGLDTHTAFSLAISTGDIVFAYVFELLASADLPPEKRLLAVRRFTETMELTGFGENLDIYLPHVPLEEVKEDKVLTVHRLKTAVYTVSFPLSLGAELAGAGSNTVAGLYEYGINAGIAFQLHDDILGVFGDPSKTGKPVGNDIREGKRTLLLLEAFRRASEEEKEVLLRAVGSNDQEILERAAEIIRNTGALEYVERLRNEHAERAAEILGELDIREEIKEFLRELTIYLVTREK